MTDKIAPRLVWELDPNELVDKTGVGCDKNPLDENGWYWVRRNTNGWGYGTLTLHPMYIFLSHAEFLKYITEVVRCQ